jgi:hypothetical protein
VEFSENPVTGVITVGTKNSIKKTKDVFKDSRSIELVNAFQLSNARQTGSGSIGITFNRAEDELGKNELESFLDSFHKAGLLSKEQLATATAHAYGDSSTLIEDAEVVAGLRWNTEQLKTLFKVASDHELDFIINEVADEMTALKVIRPSWIHEFELQINRKVLPRSMPDISLDSESPGAVLQYLLRRPELWQELQRRDANLDQNNKNTRNVLVKWYELALGLHKAIDLMAELYYSNADASAEEYEDYTQEINDCLRDWIKSASLLEMAWSLLPFTDNSKDDEVKASMLALLKILNRLSAGPDSEHSALSITMSVGEGNKKKITTLI